MAKQYFPPSSGISNSRLNAIGDRIRKGRHSSEDINEVDAWRASHLYPMNTFNSTLRKKVKSISDAIVAQRLKRLPTIIDKLSRHSNMELSKMQDIGGLRAIVPSIDDIYRLREYYIGKTNPHELYKEYDYIKNPKDDGYRGIHLVYKYRSTQSRSPLAKNYDGLKIEVQLRTKPQHAWATAVEVAGLMRGEKLKSDQGSLEWLDFFRAISKLISIAESPVRTRHKIDPDTVRESISIVKTLEAKLNVIDHLESFSQAIKSTSNLPYQNNYYYIVAADFNKKRVTLIGFAKKQSQEAIETYNQLEESNQYTDQVLVKTTGVTQLKKAYPNYFADTKDFLGFIREVLSQDVAKRNAA